MTPVPAQLPNLFLADLGPGLSLSPATIRDACFAVRRNRADWLARQRTRNLVELIAYTAEQWLQADNGFRRLALAQGPAELGFGRATLARGLDAFFRQVTVENLESLLAQDLGDPRRLDDFAAGVPEARQGRSALARGPELLVHVAAGNLPNPAWTSLLLGVLLKSGQVMKCASRASLLPRLFAHSLAHTEPKLGACLELVVWPGGDPALEEVLFAEADCLTATGGNEMLEDVRRRVPLRTRFVAHGHRVSFGFVSADVLSSYSARRAVRDAAADLTAWNQQGCLSPHVLYVEDQGAVSAEGFAEMLAAELARLENEDPRGELSLEESAAIASRRAVYELRAALPHPAGERPRVESAFQDLPSGIRLWKSEPSTAWTVVFDSDPRFEFSCLNRFIYVKPVRRFADVLHFAEPVRQQVSTVGVAAVDGRAQEIARDLARWGVPRVCPLGRMQDPPLAWRHDGRPALADLVSWTDLEN